MTEIEHAQEVLNRVPAEFRPLLNLDHLTAFTLDRQREHNADLAAYETGYAVFQAVLRSQYVHGDKKFSARIRSRRVEKQWRALVKASKDAAAASEKLRTEYADYTRAMAALPQQRADRAEKKATWRASVNSAAAKSLHKTTTMLGKQPVEDTETAGQTPTEASGGRTVRGVNDLFSKGA